MAHTRKLGYRYPNDRTIEDFKDSYVKKAITVPVNIKIDGEHRVLNLDNIEKILSKARTISLTDCVCRVKYENCDAPVNTCVDMNETAERNIRNGSAKEISYDEALKVFKETHKAGLVPMAMEQGEFYEPGVINSICNCCTCCCVVLSGLIRFGLAPHLVVSQATSVTDTSSCTDCGVCVERCQFGAREIVNGTLLYNPELCFGCGLCVSTCPTNAITLIEK